MRNRWCVSLPWLHEFCSFPHYLKVEDKVFPKNINLFSGLPTNFGRRDE